MRSAALFMAVITLLAFGSFGVVTTFGHAHDAPPQQDQKITQQQINQWITELDADDFQSREAATESLTKAGMQALDALVEAAQGQSLEVTTRAMDIITSLHETSAEEAQDKVAAALQQVAEGKNKAAASRADAILNPPQPPQPPQAQRIGGFNIVMGGNNMQVQSSTDAAGNKTINATEGDRKVDIDEKADGSIKMTVREKVDGKEKSTEYSAKDQDELKEKHKEAYELYEKYTKQMNIGIPQIQFGRINALPAVRGIRLVNPAQQQAAAAAIKEAQKELKAAVSALRRMANADDQATPEEMEKLIEQIEQAEKKIQEASENIGG